MKKFTMILLSVLYCSIAFSQTYSQTRTCTDIYFGKPEIWAQKAWQNIQNDDNVYLSTIKLRGTNSYPNTFQKLGFSIPSNAIIQGIDVNVIRSKSGQNNVSDYYVTLVTGATFNTQAGAYGNFAKTGYWPSAETNVLYSFPKSGTGTDGQPYTWTPAMINALYFAFWLHFSVHNGGAGTYVYFDQIKVTVRYTLPAVTSNIQLTPANNTIIINTEGSGVYHLVVTDVVGRLLQRTEVKDASQWVVPLNDKCRGVCIVTLEGNGERKTIKAFIK